MAEQNYPRPAVTVDCVVFSIANDALSVRLIKRSTSPYKDTWALPGGFVGINERLDDAARRVSLGKAGVSSAHLEQLYTFGEPDRDPRERVISVAYLVILSPQMRDTVSDPVDEPTVSEAGWFSLANLPELAFDHEKILSLAHRRLVNKLNYSSIAFCFLPELFTMSEAQSVHELISCQSLEKRNFRKKLLSMNFIRDSGRKTTGAHRPASLYCLIEQAGLHYWD